MKKYVIGTGLMMFLALNICAQKDEVIMTINDTQKIYKSEFEAIFKKNYKKDEVDRKDLEEYIDLFVNFRLKVAEAESLGMDTASKFKNELKGYRNQLSKPYLVDREMTDALIREAYDRMKKEVRASHILIKVEPDASPEDSLKAWNRIIEIRKRIESGEDFGNVASGKKGSEDNSAAINKGDLGFFTVFQMVYPFESAAYKIKVGELSQPVRTKYGYHIIKKTDERPARGEILAAHIMIRVMDDATEKDVENAKARIDEIYQQLKDGKDFAELATKHSDDKGSARKGGELPWFGTGKMVESFEDQAFAIENNGDFSAPFLTEYGWHIVKRIDRKDVPSFQEVEPMIKTKIQRDTRSQKSMVSFIQKLKKMHGFKDYSTKKLPGFIAHVDTTIFYGEWKPSSLSGNQTILFKYAGGKVSFADFASYLDKEQRKQKTEELDVYMHRKYKAFVRETLLNYEDDLLEGKYSEFRLLVKEYRDGILLFELTDQMVWSKAVKDSTGLEAFYKANQSNFMWEERADAEILWCSSQEVAEKAFSMLQQGIGSDSIRVALNKESALNVKMEKGKFEKSRQPWLFVDMDPKLGVVGPAEHDGKIGVARINQLLPVQAKELSEARGMAIARYQDFLEKEWIKTLRAKYKVVVNEDVLYSVK